MSRYSFKKRLSRDSRYSMGSGILDADTDNLGDEQTLWWKHLENNTIARPSIGSNVLYQTSRRLDSNSAIETGNAKHQWWKFLDTTNGDSRTTAPTVAKQDKSNNAASTSESEEEPRIAKKKYPLRSEAKKARGDAFLNILNHSGTSFVSEPSRRSRSKSSLNVSGSISKAATDTEQIRVVTKVHGDEILKSKRGAFGRNQRRNIFDDVSKENELYALSKSKSLRKSLLNKSQTFVEIGDLEATESPIIKQGVSRQFVSSFENERDISHLPAPEAQSTLLENYTTSSMQGSNRDIDNSDTEEVVLKPKFKLLRRQKKNTKKNAFKDILAEEETRHEKSANKSTDESNTLKADVSKKSLLPPPNDSFKTLQSITRNANETKESNMKEIRKSMKIDDTVIVSSQNVKKSVEHEKLVEDSIDSSDTSSSSHKSIIFGKPNSKFLKKLRRSPKRNIFEEVLVEGNDDDDDDVEARRESRYKTALDRIENVADQDQGASTSEELDLQLRKSSEDVRSTEAGEGTSKLKRNSSNSDATASKIVSKASTKTENRAGPYLLSENTKIPNRRTVNSFGNIDEERKRKECVPDNEDERVSKDSYQEDEHVEEIGSTNASKLQGQSNHSAVKDWEQNDAPGTLHKLHEDISKSGNRSTLSMTKEDRVEEIVSTLKRQNRHSSKSKQKQISFARDEIEPDETRNATKRQQENLTVSQRWLFLIDRDESESEENRNTSKIESRVSEKSQKQLPLSTNEVEPEKIGNDTNRQSGNLSKSRKRSTLGVVNESEAETRTTPKRQSEISRQSQRQVSLTTNDIEPEEILRDTDRQSGNLSNSRKRSTIGAVNESETETQTTPKRPSRILSKSLKEIFSVTNEVEAGETKNTPRRQKRNLSVSRNRVASLTVNESDTDIELFPKSRARSCSSRLRNQTDLSTVDGPKEKTDQNPPKRQSRASNKLEEQISPTTNTVKPGDTDSTVKSQSKTSNRSQTKLTIIGTSSSEEENPPAPSKRRQVRSSSRLKRGSNLSHVDDSKENKGHQSPLKRQSETSNKSEKQISRRTNITEPADTDNATNGQSKTLNRSQAWLTMFDASSSEEDDPPTPSKRRQGRSSSRLKRGSNLSNVDDSKENKGHQSSPKRQSGVSNKSEKEISRRTTNIAKPADTDNTIGSRSKTSNRSQTRLTVIDTSSSEEEKNPPAPSKRRQVRSSSRLKSGLNLSNLDGSKENEEHQSSPKRQSGVSNESEKQISRRTTNIAKPAVTDNTIRSRSKTSNRSQTRLTVIDTSSSEEEKNPPAPSKRRQVRSSSRLKSGLNLSNLDGSKENEEHQSSPKRQSGVSNESEKQISRRTTNIAKPAVTDNTIRSRSKTSNRSQTRLTVIDTSSSEEEKNPPAPSKRRQVRSSSRLKSGLNLSNLDGSKENEEHQSSPKRQSGVSNESEKQISRRTTNIAKPAVTDNTIRSRSKTSNRSQTRLTVIDTSSSEEEKNPPAPSKRRQVRSSSRLKSGLNLSNVDGPKENEEHQSSPKRQSGVSNESEKQASFVINNRGSDEIDSATKGQSQKSNKSQRRSASACVGESKIEFDANTGRNSLSVTKKLSNVIEPSKRFTFTPNIVDGDDQISSGASNDKEEEEAASTVSRSKKDLNKAKYASEDVNVFRRMSTASVSQTTNNKGRSVERNRRKTVSKIGSSIPAVKVSANPIRNASKDQRSIEDFLSIGKLVSASQGFADKQKQVEVKQKLAEIQKLDLMALKASQGNYKCKLPSQEIKKRAKTKRNAGTVERRPVQHKAFMINGQEYKIPPLVRPKYWVTDRLYNHLWKCLEPKYKRNVKTVSEKFVMQLAEVTTFIVKQKSYVKYKAALRALIKEMARLGIVGTLLDFHHFCQDFFPAELRFKTVPMRLPGNKMNIPFNPDKLNEPIIDEE